MVEVLVSWCANQLPVTNSFLTVHVHPDSAVALMRWVRLLRELEYIMSSESEVYYWWSLCDAILFIFEIETNLCGVRVALAIRLHVAADTYCPSCIKVLQLVSIDCPVLRKFHKLSHHISQSSYLPNVLHGANYLLSYMDVEYFLWVVMVGYFRSVFIHM